MKQTIKVWEVDHNDHILVEEFTHVNMKETLDRIENVGVTWCSDNRTYLSDEVEGDRGVKIVYEVELLGGPNGWPRAIKKGLQQRGVIQ